MKAISLGILVLITAATCGAQTSLFPRHIEPPVYPPIAYVAHISGVVVLTVTIDAGGRVLTAEAADGPPLLVAVAIRNVQSWTFDRPAAAPFAETFVYDFRINGEAPQEGECTDPSSRVTFDLPNRVTIERRPERIVDRFPRKNKSNSRACVDSS